VEGYREHGNERTGSIKCREVLEQLHNWQLLKKGSAPWVTIFCYSCELINLICVMDLFEHLCPFPRGCPSQPNSCSEDTMACALATPVCEAKHNLPETETKSLTTQSESWDSKMWSWVPPGPEPRVTVLKKASSNSPDRPTDRQEAEAVEHKNIRKNIHY
jgi:hypothetical protein